MQYDTTLKLKGAANQQPPLRSLPNTGVAEQASQSAVARQSVEEAEDSDSDSEQDDIEETAAREAREAERSRVLQAAGVLSRNPTRRRAPPPKPKREEQHSPIPMPPAEPSPVYTEAEVEQNTEDAYDRWVAMQREMPALPST